MRPLLLILLALAVVGAGVAIRFTRLEEKVFWNDEIYTAMWTAGWSVREMADSLVARRVVSHEDFKRFLTVGRERSLGRGMAVLARDDPKQPALYLLLTGIWARTVGDSPGRLRALSALFGVLSIPAAFWFVRAVGGGRPEAWLAAGLMSLSPFQVLYAQEARPYTLWILMSLVSGAALARSLSATADRGGRGWWILYGATVALGLYAHTFFVLVVAGQVYVAWRAGHGAGRPPVSLRAFWLALGAGVAVYLPWTLFILKANRALQDNTSWVTRVEGYPTFLSRLVLALGLPFVDSGLSHSGPIAFPRDAVPFLALVVPAAGLSVGLLALAAHRLEPRARDSLVGLWAPPILALLLPDLIFGGTSFSTARFMAPALTAITLAAALVLGRIRRAAWMVMVLAAAGLVCDARLVTSESWWNKYLNANVPRVAETIDRTPGALVVGGGSGLDLMRLASLSYRTRPDTRFLLLVGDAAPAVPDWPAGIFVHTTSKAIRDALQKKGGFKLEPLDAEVSLWRLIRPAGAP